MCRPKVCFVPVRIVPAPEREDRLAARVGQPPLPCCEVDNPRYIAAQCPMTGKTSGSAKANAKAVRAEGRSSGKRPTELCQAPECAPFRVSRCTAVCRKRQEGSMQSRPGGAAKIMSHRHQPCIRQAISTLTPAMTSPHFYLLVSLPPRRPSPF